MFLKTFLRPENSAYRNHGSPPVTSPEVVSLFEDILSDGSLLRVRVTGKSMEPFLLGGEVLTIKKVPYCSLKRGDLILFKRIQGNPVVHRIIRKRRDHIGKIALQTKGDALTFCDEPVREEDVLGRVCRIERTGSLIDMDTKVQESANYLIAITHRIRSGICSAVVSARSLLRAH